MKSGVGSLVCAQDKKKILEGGKIYIESDFYSNDFSKDDLESKLLDML